jgi:glutaredoxin
LLFLSKNPEEVIILTLTYKFFMTPMCPDCGEIKEFIKQQDIKGEIIDATVDAGLELAQKYEVTNVPTVVFLNENEEVVSEASSVDDIKKILENKPISSFD